MSSLARLYSVALVALCAVTAAAQRASELRRLTRTNVSDTFVLMKLSLAALLTLTASLAGQIGRGETGLQLVSGGVTYGVVCSPTFSCTYIPASLVRGMPADILVRGVLGRPFALAFGSDQPHQCLTLPGIHNQLMGPLLAVPVVGTLATQDTIRACPGGVISIPLQVPASLPRGVVLTMQALAWSYLAPNETPTFTQALRVVVV